MKNFKFTAVIVAVVAVAAIVGCSKKDSTPASLVAKWRLSSFTVHSVQNGKDTTASRNYPATDYVDFRTDNKLYLFSDSLFGGYDTSSYVITGSNVIVTGNSNGPDTLLIKNLTTSSVGLYQKQFDSTGVNYLEQTINLTK